MPPGVAARRVLLAGAGKPEKFDAAELRKLVGAAVRLPEVQVGEEHRARAGSGWATGPDYVAAAVEGAILGDFEPDRYKTGEDKKAVDSFTVVRRAAGGLDAAVERGRIMAEAQNFTRGLANEPANRLTPSQDGGSGAADGFRVRPGVRSARQAADGTAGHGRLLGVAQGSAEPPALIVHPLPARSRRPQRRTWVWWAKA